MKLVYRVAALALALALAAPAVAGQRFRQFRQGRRARMVMGNDAASKVENLLGALDWKTSLDGALKQAASEDKLVFWVHMLGKIDGST